MPFRLTLLALVIAVLCVGFGGTACTESSRKSVGLSRQLDREAGWANQDRDIHSFSNPNQIKVNHLDWGCEVVFGERTLRAAAILRFERNRSDASGVLILDTRGLHIHQVDASQNGTTYTAVSFSIGAADPILGAPLSIQLPPGATQVRVRYTTSPDAQALQWLSPAQTGGKQYPFLYTQSQSIHARSWIPLQDSPGVRITYTAHVKTSPGLLAVMSAEIDFRDVHRGEYRFGMSQPIPPYLVALAVGNLSFRPLGSTIGVYAEPYMVERAAWEFADTAKMVQAVEKLYGPYRWGRFDVLVLPPSFPMGGMENPRLTFATPTVLAGDRSQVSLVAHELAHSWSGNLVSNATWSDFWLNEGFTTYIERRVLEEIYGRERAETEAVLGLEEMKTEMLTLPERDTLLHLDLAGRDPEEGVTSIPYEKGYLFLRHLEEIFGRVKFDEFLRHYFDHFAFQSITTARFLAYLNENLLARNPEASSRLPVEEWIDAPGLPANAPRPFATNLANVERLGDQWVRGEIPTSQIPIHPGRDGVAVASSAGKNVAKEWNTQEVVHFLRHLPANLSPGQMAGLDQAFRFTQTGNAEIATQWLLMAIRNQYHPADSRLEQHLATIGRLKLIRPLYAEMSKSLTGKQQALAIYRKVRSGYHPLTVAAINGILGVDKP